MSIHSISAWIPLPGQQAPGCLAITPLPGLGGLLFGETHPLPSFRSGMQKAAETQGLPAEALGSDRGRKPCMGKGFAGDRCCGDSCVGGGVGEIHVRPA